MDSPIKPKKPKLMKNSGGGSRYSLQLAVSAVSTATASPEAFVSNDDDLFEKVFTNDIVWNKLGSFLSLADLKDCRLTCQLFNTKIIRLKSFRDRALLNIPLSKLIEFPKTWVQCLHLAIKFDPGIKKKYPCDFREDALSTLLPLLSSIISLKLYRTDCFTFGMSAEVLETLAKILPMMPNIQKIWIDGRIFEKVDPTWFSRATVALMSKVKEFHLEWSSPNDFVPDEVMLSSMSLPLTSAYLQVLRIDVFVGAWPYRRARGTALDRLDKLLPILRENQNHLRSFQVKDPLLWTSMSATQFSSLPKFPQLRVLHLKMDTEESSQVSFSEAHFIQFLNNQPESLEEIDLDFIGPIPSAAFQVIKSRAMKLELKVLRITTTEFKPSHMNKWNFLKETNLEEFYFQLEEGSVRLSNEQLKEFFGALPKNAQKLSITGVMPGFYEAVFNLEVSKCFEPKTLTHLKLQGLVGLLNDSVLQDFWKTLKNLRLLDLSYCACNCTDWGFTGVPVEFGTQGVPISSVKGLKSLALQYCFGLTDRTLLDGIAFPELQFLDLQYSVQFTKSGFLAVVRQNPMLRTFITDHDHDTYENLITHRNPTGQMLFAKINSRLTREFRLDDRCERCRRVDDIDDDQ